MGKRALFLLDFNCLDGKDVPILTWSQPAFSVISCGHQGRLKTAQKEKERTERKGDDSRARRRVSAHADRQQK